MVSCRRGKAQAGGILIMTLVFVSMFAVIFIALSGLTSRQYHEGTNQLQEELAFQIAEAGLNYGRWRLAHDDDNFTAVQKDVEDQFAGTIGTYSLTFEQPQEGSTIVSITSVGATTSSPTRQVTLKARYGIPSLARYAAITNSDVYYTGELKGYVHANGGIRMDGESDSLMTSAKATYTCKPYHGCNNLTKPGIWGTGEREELWEFPVTPVDYNSITVNLLDIKTAAQSTNTYYAPSGALGYSVVFNSNNTYSVYKVTQKTTPVWSQWTDGASEYLSHDIQTQVFVHTKAVPSGGSIFFEDNVWVKGEIRDRVTVAAGKFPDQPSTNVDIIINGSITYGGLRDGSRAFGAIAQRNVLIPYSAVPDRLELDGAYIAQKGRFGRRYYASGTHRLKNKIEKYGMIASNGIPVTAYISGGSVVSGFEIGETTYDPYLVYGPPPMFPTNGQYEFLSWEQVE